MSVQPTQLVKQGPLQKLGERGDGRAQCPVHMGIAPSAAQACELGRCVNARAVVGVQRPGGHRVVCHCSMCMCALLPFEDCRACAVAELPHEASPLVRAAAHATCTPMHSGLCPHTLLALADGWGYNWKQHHFIVSGGTAPVIGYFFNEYKVGMVQQIRVRSGSAEGWQCLCVCCMCT